MPMQAVLLGFGGSGANILTYVKEIAVWKYGQVPPTLKFLLFDTIENWEAGKTVPLQGGRDSEKLAESRDRAGNLDRNTEYFHLRDSPPLLRACVTKQAKLPEVMENWLHTDWLATVNEAALNIKDGAAQQRQIGRFALFKNARRIKDGIKDLLSQTGAGNIWLAGSAAGGTGAGAMLDAAFLARIAAKELGIEPKLTAVIVLPEVYFGTNGINHGRAYSLFRELDRLQENGIPPGDRFNAGHGEEIMLRVDYDSASKLTATRSLSLFDYLFYVGDKCEKPGKRETFFTSVANSIDPHLDDEAGNTLLRASVNDATGAKVPSSFGARRVYLPAQTLGRLYAWQEVQRFVKAVAPHRTEGGTVSGLIGEREPIVVARARFDSLLPFFEHLARMGENGVDKWAASVAQYDATAIVQERLQLASAQSAQIQLSPDEERLIGTTYRNPYYSLTKAEETVPADEIRVKTWAEAKKAKEKETAGESRDRFVKGLEDEAKRYCRPERVEGAFANGAGVIATKLGGRLRTKLDEQVLAAFRNASATFEADTATPLTSEFSVLDAMLVDDGPLKLVQRVIREMIVGAQALESKRLQDLTQEQAALKEWQQPSLWRGGMMDSVTSLQEAARSAASERVRAYQRLELLRLVDHLLKDTEDRVRQWRELFKQMLERLVLKPRPEESALAFADGAINELKTRLQVQLDSPVAVIDPISAVREQKGDPELHGYREHLRRETTVVKATDKPLAVDLADRSSWLVEVDNGRPSVKLRVGDVVYDADTIGRLPQELSERFRLAVANELSSKSIFDYLQYCVAQATDRIDAKQIATQILARDARALISLTENAGEKHFLVYKAPLGDHRTLAQAIEGHIPGLTQTVKHSDRFSITLLTLTKPTDVGLIQDVQQCRNEYLSTQLRPLTNNHEENQELRRAEVYHIFRPELEAWYLERSVAIERGSTVSLTPPRIVRLLEKPARLRAFVACLATGVVAKDEMKQWWWRTAGQKEYRLTKGPASVLQAGITFVLKEEEEGSSRRPISREDAERGAAEAAAKSGKSLSTLLAEFRDSSRLEAFLNDAFAQPREADPAYARERDGMRLVLEFYSVAGVPSEIGPMLPVG